MKQKIFCRKGTHQGFQHRKLGFNNQDGVLLESFYIPSFGKTYHVGIVCDGCTGLPGYSKTEVGGSLLPVFAYARLQEFVCNGIQPPELPRVLYQSCTEFMRDLANKIMPVSIAWDYPPEFKKLAVSRKDIAARLAWDVTARFRADYLSATMLGFVSDEQQIVVFQSGDGVILVNDELTIIEQDNKPDYMVYSINNPGQGFGIKTYEVADIQRFALCSDGLRHLMDNGDGTPSEFCDRMFSHEPRHILGLQLLLNNTFVGNEDKMGDDCSGVTLENLGFKNKTAVPKTEVVETKQSTDEVVIAEAVELTAPTEQAPATEEKPAASVSEKK